MSRLWPEGPWSGRADLNRRPPAPKAGALTSLRYAPTRPGRDGIGSVPITATLEMQDDNRAKP